MVDSVARPTPRNGALGAIADLLRAANDRLDIKSPSYRQGDFHLPIGSMLGLDKLSSVADHASYGDSPFVEANNVTGSPFPTFKTGRSEELRDATMAALPMIGPAGAAVRSGGLSAARAVDQAMMNGSGPLSRAIPEAMRPAFAVKNKGGNWDKGSLDAYIDDMTQNVQTGDGMFWANTVLKNHIKNNLGTSDDPMLKLGADQLHIPKNELSRRASSRGINGAELEYYNDNPYQQNSNPWGALSDSDVSSYPVSDVVGNGREPWMDKVDQNTPVYRLKSVFDGPPYNNRLGFQDMVDFVDNLGLSTKDLKNYPVELAAQRMAEQRASQAAAIASPTVHTTFPDGSTMVRLDKPGQFADESDRMGHSVRGYEPGSANSSYGVGSGGWKAIQDGTAQVHSLRDPKGKSVATIETEHPVGNYLKLSALSEPDRAEFVKNLGPWGRDQLAQYGDNMNLDFTQSGDLTDGGELIPHSMQGDRPDVTQIKGQMNDPVKSEYRSHIMDWLNANHPNSRISANLDMSDNNITDIGNIDNDSSYFAHPGYVSMVKSAAGDNRFVNPRTLDDLWSKYANNGYKAIEDK